MSARVFLWVTYDPLDLAPDRFLATDDPYNPPKAVIQDGFMPWTCMGLIPDGRAVLNNGLNVETSAGCFSVEDIVYGDGFISLNSLETYPAV